MWAISENGWRGWRPCSAGTTAPRPAHREGDPDTFRRQLRIMDSLPLLFPSVLPKTTLLHGLHHRAILRPRAVSRYFWVRALGDSGRVISIRPASSAGCM